MDDRAAMDDGDVNDPTRTSIRLAKRRVCKFVRYALTRYSAIRSEANLGAVTSGRPARTTPPPSRPSSVRRGVGELTVVIRTVRRGRRGST